LGYLLLWLLYYLRLSIDLEIRGLRKSSISLFINYLNLSSG
jgi:hypothetical protein